MSVEQEQEGFYLRIRALRKLLGAEEEGVSTSLEEETFTDAPPGDDSRVGCYMVVDDGAIEVTLF